MRDTLVDPYEALPRAVVVTRNEYPAGSTFPCHAHRRGQFAFAARGTITVATPQGRWLVPPQRACWVPAEVEHDMTMGGAVTMINVFVSASQAAATGLPPHCCVQDVSTLLRQLLDEAVDLPALYALQGRAGLLMELLVAEIAVMPQLSLHAPLPDDASLMRACQQVLDAPSIAPGLDAVAAAAGMRRRTFTRRFRAHTGLGFAQWRQQVCLLVAIARLDAGQSVTRVALDLGYASPSAFAYAFRQLLGHAPSQYLGTPERAPGIVGPNPIHPWTGPGPQ